MKVSIIQHETDYRRRLLCIGDPSSAVWEFFWAQVAICALLEHYGADRWDALHGWDGLRV